MKSLTQKQVISRLRTRGILLVGKFKGVTSFHTFKCSKKGHVWEAKADHMKRQNCPYCPNRNGKRLTIEELEKEIEKLNPHLHLLETSYRGALHKIKVRCRLCKTKFKTTWNVIKSGYGKCPRCAPVNLAASESNVREIIERITGWRFPRARPSWLQGRSKTLGMQLDGYNERHGVAFEYQGAQHYKPVKWFGGHKALRKIRRNDERKRVLCYNRGVILIRVPYFKKDVEGFILRKLRRAGISVP